MSYPETIRLEFSDGFLYHGPGSVLTVTATANLPVSGVAHAATGRTLTDGQVITGDPAAFDIPNPGDKGWTTNGGSHISRWPYDIAVTIAAEGAPTILWVGTINPRRATETITPGMGSVSGGSGGAVNITALSDGIYQIGA